MRSWCPDVSAPEAHPIEFCATRELNQHRSEMYHFHHRDILSVRRFLRCSNACMLYWKYVSIPLVGSKVLHDTWNDDGHVVAKLITNRLSLCPVCLWLVAVHTTLPNGKLQKRRHVAPIEI
jgi:hypothetical protein